MSDSSAASKPDTNESRLKELERKYVALSMQTMVLLRVADELIEGHRNMKIVIGGVLAKQQGLNVDELVAKYCTDPECSIHHPASPTTQTTNNGEQNANNSDGTDEKC